MIVLNQRLDKRITLDAQKNSLQMFWKNNVHPNIDDLNVHAEQFAFEINFDFVWTMRTCWFSH